MATKKVTKKKRGTRAPVTRKPAIWRTADGERIPVPMMENDHLENALRMLLRAALRWQTAELEKIDGIARDHGPDEVALRREVISMMTPNALIRECPATRDRGGPALLAEYRKRNTKEMADSAHWMTAGASDRASRTGPLDPKPTERYRDRIAMIERAAETGDRRELDFAQIEREDREKARLARELDLQFPRQPSKPVERNTDGEEVHDPIWPVSRKTSIPIVVSRKTTTEARATITGAQVADLIRKAFNIPENARLVIEQDQAYTDDIDLDVDMNVIATWPEPVIDEEEQRVAEINRLFDRHY